MRKVEILLARIIPCSIFGLLLFTMSSAHAEMVSYYDCGSITASGERFDPDGFTAASRTLPFGTRLQVTRGNVSVVVRVNDRGPFVAGRVLDLSRGAARALGMIEQGVAKVTIGVLQ